MLSNSCLIAEFCAKIKMPKFGTKSALVGNFWTGIWKYCNFWNQRPRICIIANFHAKIKILKFGTKNALFGCFGQQFWKIIVIFEVCALQFVLFQNLGQKLKLLNLEQKISYLGIFGIEFENYVLEIMTPEWG